MVFTGGTQEKWLSPVRKKPEKKKAGRGRRRENLKKKGGPGPRWTCHEGKKTGTDRRATKRRGNGRKARGKVDTTTGRSGHREKATTKGSAPPLPRLEGPVDHTPGGYKSVYRGGKNIKRVGGADLKTRKKSREVGKGDGQRHDGSRDHQRQKLKT